MSSTDAAKLDHLLKWLGDNAYWNRELEVRKSEHGLGVYGDVEKLQPGELLLRVPKCNILSPKNSFIYSLIVDYQQEHPETMEYLSGMNLLVLCVIYELSIGKQSPWFDYLISIENIYEEKLDTTEIPTSLWTDEDKKNLRNTQLDLFGLLDPKEILTYYTECVKFARYYKHLVLCPFTLNVGDEVSEDELGRTDTYKLSHFGKLFQIVNSRAFMVDEFYELSLVPAADLFNHIHSVMIDGKVRGQENVHFICDSNACDECGEIDCEEHVSSDTEEMEYDSDEDVNATDDSDDSDRLLSDDSKEDGDSDPKDTQGSEIKEITMDFIKNMEKELEHQEEEGNDQIEENSEASTIQEEEELSTLSAEEGDEDGKEEFDSDIDEDLKQELSNASKCCDMVLVSFPSKSYNYEIFNSYHQTMANPFLLDRYGFITKENPADFVTLSVEFLRHIKHLKENLSQVKQAYIDEKIEWLSESGFEAINKVIQRSSPGDNEDEDEDESEIDSVWEYSVKILSTGAPSEHTYVLLNLLALPSKVFPLLKTNKEHALLERVKKYLFKYDKPSLNRIIKEWCSKKLSKYPELIESPRIDTITSLVKKEQDILVKFIESI